MAVTTSGLAPNAVTSRLRTSLTGTPGMLRAGLAASLVALVLFGALAVNSTAVRRSALEDARGAAAQVVLIQRVHTSLVEADALATNAFLVGGIEPAEQRAGYQAGIERASEALATAASNASGTDLADLQAANAALARYTGLIESARANNRQGFPVGVAYLRQASDLLDSEVLPVLDEVSAASERRVDDAYDSSGSARWGLAIAAVIVLVALIACQLLLARATRRTLNVGLAAGTALVLVAVVWGGFAMATAASRANDARDGAYRDTTAVAEARIASFSAKSAESLTLINRGNGQTFEEDWKADMATATDALAGADDADITDSLTAALDGYRDIHVEIRALDDEGNWEDAVAQATGTDASSSNVAFTAFAEPSAATLDQSASAVDSKLDDARSPLGSARIVILLLTLLAAVAVVWGFNQRLKEYR